ncbi:MAG: 50S ribosomal protein L3 [Kiritimatiellia bacterium]
MRGLIGKKLGMTSVFDSEGRQVPVTIVECGPCVVMRCKAREHDGYEAVQLGYGDVKESRMTKPEAGCCRKANLPLKKHRQEFELEEGDSFKVGDVITVKVFDGTGYVDVSGVTKGKGFQGVMRRHNMKGGVMTHGGHSKRRVGSVGCRELPGRIHKNKRMPGHMGHVNVTQQNLKVIQVRPDDNLILVRGAVPGAEGSILTVRKALKKADIK